MLNIKNNYVSTFMAMCLCLGLISCLSSHAYGHGAGGDIALFSTNGQVDVGFAILDSNDDIQLVFDPDEDVFFNVLLPSTPTPFVPWQFASDEPGFDADNGTLPAGAEISFNLLDLWYWDPTTSSSVSLSPAGSSISAGVAPQGESVFGNGGFHDHPFYGINSTSGVPADGIYVGKLTVSVDGLDDSDPYYMVSVVTDVVTGLGNPGDQVTTAEEIGELVRNYLDDPGTYPAPMHSGTDFTYFADAVTHVRALAAIPEPSSAVLLTVLLTTLGGVRIGRS